MYKYVYTIILLKSKFLARYLYQVLNFYFLLYDNAVFSSVLWVKFKQLVIFYKNIFKVWHCRG